MSEEKIISTEINENVNINGSVNITEDGNKTQIMYMSCSLNADTFGVNINVTVLNKEKYKENATQVKAEYEKFNKLCNERATALGYVIF